MKVPKSAPEHSHRSNSGQGMFVNQMVTVKGFQAKKNSKQNKEFMQKNVKQDKNFKQKKIPCKNIFKQIKS